MDEKQDNNAYLIPASIIVAGALIAFAVLYTRGAPAPDSKGNSGGDDSSAAISIKPITSDDHFLGNPDAPVKIVEFSDLECPFCKTFHPTLRRILNEYGKDGRVAWVYRHFPLQSLHPKAPKEAEASECAAELGGNDKFWAYIDRVFAITPSNNGLDPLKLPQIAADIGLDPAKFQTCLDSGKYSAKVQENYEDAVAAGGNGTPYTVLVTKNGKTFSVSGALPYDQVKKAVEEALKSL